LQSHPRLRDDAENAFRADEEPVRARSRARPGQAPCRDAALRRHDDDAFDEIVDMGQERREMPAGTGRDPAAQRRVLEALREVAERQAMRLELRLERRAENSGLDARSARGAVDLDDAPQAAEIDAERGLVARTIETRLDAADDARAAAEG